MQQEPSVFDALGEAGIAQLTAAFYRRVAEDELLRPMYPDDLAPAEQRLRDFLIYRLGGPDRYIQQRGHPRLRMRHMPFAIDTAARDRWMEHMTAAMGECQISAEIRDVLVPFFDHVATFLINRPG